MGYAVKLQKKGGSIEQLEYTLTDRNYSPIHYLGYGNYICINTLNTIVININGTNIAKSYTIGTNSGGYTVDRFDFSLNSGDTCNITTNTNNTGFSLLIKLPTDSYYTTYDHESKSTFTYTTDRDYRYIVCFTCGSFPNPSRYISCSTINYDIASYMQTLTGSGFRHGLELLRNVSKGSVLTPVANTPYGGFLYFVWNNQNAKNDVPKELL